MLFDSSDDLSDFEDFPRSSSSDSSSKTVCLSANKRTLFYYAVKKETDHTKR